MKKTCNTIVSISLLVATLACTSVDQKGGRDAGVDAGTTPDGSVEQAGVPCTKAADCIDYSSCTNAQCEDGVCLFERGDESLDVLTLSGPSEGVFLGLQDNYVLTAQENAFKVFDLSDSTPSMFSPVCGMDGKTYGHPCHAGCAGVEVKNMGGCAGGSCKSSDDCPGGLVCQTGACISNYDTCLCPAPLDLASERLPDEAAFTGVYAHESGWIVVADRELYFRDAAGEPHTRNSTDDPRKDYTASDRVYDLVHLEEQRIALAVYTKGIEVVDVGGGKLVELIARVDTLGRAQALATVETLILVADGLLGLGEVDVSNAEKPAYQDDPLETEGRVRRVKVSGRTILTDEGGIGYGVARYSGLRPERTALIPMKDGLSGIALADPSTALLVTEAGKVFAVDLTDPSAPKNWLEADLKDTVEFVTEDRGRLLVRLKSGRVVLARLSCGTEGEEALFPQDDSPNDANTGGAGGMGMSPVGGQMGAGGAIP